jgi:hypothetical protein
MRIYVVTSDRQGLPLLESAEIPDYIPSWNTKAWLEREISLWPKMSGEEAENTSWDYDADYIYNNANDLRVYWDAEKAMQYYHSIGNNSLVALLNCALADLEGMIDIVDPDNDEDNRHPGRNTIEEIKIFLEHQKSLDK